MKWTNGMIKQIAMEQSAIDANCSVNDFVCGKNIVTVSKENELARKYLKLPHVCNLISYGDNIIFLQYIFEDMLIVYFSFLYQYFYISQSNEIIPVRHLT